MSRTEENNLTRGAGAIALLNPFTSSVRHSRGRDPDWQEIWRFCTFHGVRPTLLQVLGRHENAPSPPEWLECALSEFKRRHAFRVMQLTGEIVALAKALEEAGIDAVFFKGAVLAEQIYGGAQHREFNDIDVLVAPSDQECAADLLQARGYQPAIADRRFRRAFLDYAGQHVFNNAGIGSTVDLHWNFVGNQAFPVANEAVLRDRKMLPLGGQDVPAPIDEHLALILAGHGQKEGWASFGWALDFAKFAAARPQFDWELAADQARVRGSSRALLTALLLTETLFGETLNADLIAEASASDLIRADVEAIVRKHEDLAIRTLADDLMGAFRLCETPCQRARAWLGLLTTRTLGDYQSFPLPPSMWWVYRFTRPFRLGWARLSGAGPSKATLAAAQGGSANQQ